MGSKRWPCLAVVLAICLGAQGCGGGGADKAGGSKPGEPVVLTMANSNGDATELGPFAAAVARLSGGTLRIRFENAWRGGQADYESGLIRDVAAGKADLGWAGSRAFDDVGVTSLDALHAPLLIDSFDLQRRVLASPLAGRMLAGLEPLGVTGLGILPGPMRHPAGAVPLAGPSDYRGRTIALNRSEVGALSLRALGAQPHDIARGGPIKGYDGVEQQIGSIEGNAYDDSAPYLTANVTLWPRPIVLFANPRSLRRLSEHQRDALRDAVRTATPGVVAIERAQDKESGANLCRKGRTFVVASAREIAALRTAVQPVYDRLSRDATTKTAIAQITAMRAAAPDAAQREAPTCTQSTAPSVGSAASPIDGRYRFTIDKAELEAISPPGEPVAEENYGGFEWVIDHGRFAWHQRNGSAAWEDTTGTYEVHGEIVKFTVGHVEGLHPNNATAKRGEQFTFRWSRYRDQLTLRAVDGAVSPPGLTLKPWRRLGDARLPAPAAPRTPLDGAYRMTSRSHDFAEPATPANYGTWIYVFDRGRFAITQENRLACTWGYGTYTVTGNRMHWKFTDGGGESPDFAFNKPGEQFDYTWSKFRDTVRVGPVEGAISPDNFDVNPWRMLSTTPSARYLSSRCPPPAAAFG
jgi:TRAP-type C4-dicarboxylate transport system substrate-binding protein